MLKQNTAFKEPAKQSHIIEYKRSKRPLPHSN
jgi:hypothetical protein